MKATTNVKDKTVLIKSWKKIKKKTTKDTFARLHRKHEVAFNYDMKTICKKEVYVDALGYTKEPTWTILPWMVEKIITKDTK